MLEVAVVGSADPNGLVKPKAYVVLKEGVAGSDGLAPELMQIGKTQRAPYTFQRLIQLVQELPGTATGKIQRFRLRQLAPAPVAVPATGTGR